MNISPELKRKILNFQANEITEHLFYKEMAARSAHAGNRAVLEKIAAEELAHYGFWKKYTATDVKPERMRIFFYRFIARFLGLTFAAKVMEKGEHKSQAAYAAVIGVFPEIEKMIEDEKAHEAALLKILNEKHLQYVSSIVLGLNDALVELTGALAGLTFALRNAQIIALAGFITGVSAAFSMASAEYLSTKAGGAPRREALQASFYTGLTYLAVVLILIAPYLGGLSVYSALGLTLAIGLIIVWAFSFYIAVIQDASFKSQFLEMAGLTIGVAVLTFLIGLAARRILNIEI